MRTSIRGSITALAGRQTTAFLLGSVVLSGASTAWAADRYWAIGNSDWGYNFAWAATQGGVAGAGAPVAGDSATISLGTTTTVTRGALSSSYTSPMYGVYIAGLNGASVTLNQTVTTLLTNNFYLSNAQGSRAELDLSGGEISADFFAAASMANSTATINLSSSGTFLSQTTSLATGTASSAVFNQNFGSFSVGALSLATGAGSQATYNLNNGSVSASAVNIGAVGSGTFNMSNTAGVNVVTIGKLQVGTGGAGTLIVGGGNFTTTGTTTIGQSGNVWSNASVSASWQANAPILVDGGSLDTTHISLFMLNNGTNSLTVQNGGSFIGNNFDYEGGAFATSVLANSQFSVNLLKLAAGNVFNLTGGTVNAGTISADASHFLFNSGTVNFTNSTAVNVAPGQFLNGSTLDALKAVSFAGPLNLQGGSTITLAGGTLSASSIGVTGSGTINFQSGTLRLTGSPFSIGVGALFGDTVNLGSNSRVITTGSNQAVIFSGGTLYANGGTLNAAGGIVNNGQIVLANALSRISGGTLTNGGSISGVGRIDSVLNNTGTVQTASGDHLSFTAAGNTSSGTIQLLGGVADFAQNLTNNGRVIGRGSLFANGGLTNNGTMIFSGGPADIEAPVTNSAAARVLVTGGSNTTFYGNVSNASGTVITVDPASVVTFLGTYAGGTVTGSGTQIYRAPGSFAIVEGGGTTYVDPGASLTATHIRSAALNIQGPTAISSNGTSAGTSKVNALNISGSTNAWTSQLDLTNNALIVDYAGASPLATIQNQIKSGFNGGGWNGNGITTSFGNAGHVGLGYGEAASIPGAGGGSFAGQAVDNTSVIVKQTYFGDFNLDGQVNVLDLGLLASHWQQNGAWTAGDANYDGKIDVIDLGLLASNWQAGVTSPSDMSFQQAMALVGFGSSVPEPASLLLASTLLFISRRRRA